MPWSTWPWSPLRSSPTSTTSPSLASMEGTALPRLRWASRETTRFSSSPGRQSSTCTSRGTRRSRPESSVSWTTSGSSTVNPLRKIRCLRRSRWSTTTGEVRSDVTPPFIYLCSIFPFSLYPPDSFINTFSFFTANFIPTHLTLTANKGATVNLSMELLSSQKRDVTWKYNGKIQLYDSRKEDTVNKYTLTHWKLCSSCAGNYYYMTHWNDMINRTAVLTVENAAFANQGIYSASYVGDSPLHGAWMRLIVRGLSEGGQTHTHTHTHRASLQIVARLFLCRFNSLISHKYTSLEIHLNKIQSQNPSFHPSSHSANPWRVGGGAGANHSAIHAQIHTYGQLTVSNQPNPQAVCVGLWVEKGKPTQGEHVNSTQKEPDTQ